MSSMRKLAIVCGALLLIGLGTWMSMVIVERLSSTLMPNKAAPTQPVLITKQPPIQITLPGAPAINAIVEDYYAADSLWVVVSKDRPLGEPNYTPAGLAVPNVTVNDEKSLEEQSLRSDVIPQVEKLFSAAKRAGHDIMLASGYRSYQLQQTYYFNYVRVSGETEANKYSAKPGQSEHQTGLAFDISLTSRQCYLETCFGDTPAGKWLEQNAADCGFILRYPTDKTDITRYQYEPWHFRYVGRDMALALKKSGLSLDEAWPYLESARKDLQKRDLITE